MPETLTLEQQVIEVIKTIYDPEIPVNIYDLGLIYQVEADEATGNVFIRMTLTTPNCPAAETLPGQVEREVADIPDVNEVELKLVFDPPFTPDMMSEEARLMLGFL